MAVAFLVALLGVAHPVSAGVRKRGRAKKAKAQVEAPAVPRAPDPNRVTIATEDGVSLAATWHPVEGHPEAPALLLVHDFSRDRRQWDVLAPDLASRGFATLAIDLRAHGESLHKLGSAAPLHPSPRLLRDSASFPRDVRAACAWLRRRSTKVGVFGLSIGGNLGVLATASGWADAGVAVSPNADRLVSLAGALPRKPRGMLVMASENDPERATSARNLTQQGEGPKKLLLFAGAAHGIALLTERPEALRAALDWLAERLSEAPPVSPAAPSSQSQQQVAPSAVGPPDPVR